MISHTQRLDVANNRFKVLVVDDEPQLKKALIDYLEHHRFTAIGASDRGEALRMMSAQKPDLILLDLHLGDDDGLALLRDLRTRSALPVILMTGHLQDNADRVIGLESGADDYLLKPFDMRELVARVRANLRRREMDRDSSEWPSGLCYRFDGWTFNQRARTLATPDGRDVNLTKSEFALLSTLVSEPHRAFSRQQLLQTTRIHDEIDDRSIDVLILRLRRKLEAVPSGRRLIKTSRGVGYVFDAEVVIQ